MTELAFRNATVADVAALVPLVTSAYRGDASRVGWTTEADFLDGNRIDPDVLRADIERPRSRVLLAERGDALSACAPVADEVGTGYFAMVAVVPGLQGGGIRKALMPECLPLVRHDCPLPSL